MTRVAQNRNVLVEEEDECEDPTAKHLKTLARRLPAQGAMVMTIPAQHGRPEREALVNISWSQVAIQPPVDGTALHMTQVKASLVRVWEPEPPEGVEALGMDLSHFRHGQHHRGGLATGHVVQMAMVCRRFP